MMELSEGTMDLRKSYTRIRTSQLLRNELFPILRQRSIFQASTRRLSLGGSVSSAAAMHSLTDSL